MTIRIGHGYDVHRFAAEEESGLAIRLGGVDIPHNRRLLAHSDGDVVLHALCDALLGALALGDIGKHFPDSDPAYRNIDSNELLARVYSLVTGQGWSLTNADLTVIAEAPKLAPHSHPMRESIAAGLASGIERISVKATTCEGLGFAGRREGIACQAVVLLGTAGED